MSRVAFIGLGAMGGGMAANQAKAGHEVHAFDLSAAALERARGAGCRTPASAGEAVRDADVVITMGCGDACPVYPGKRYLDWQVRDPAGLSLGEVRAIRTDIDTRVRALLAELHPAAAQT